MGCVDASKRLINRWATKLAEWSEPHDDEVEQNQTPVFRSIRVDNSESQRVKDLEDCLDILLDELADLGHDSPIVAFFEDRRKAKRQEEKRKTMEERSKEVSAKEADRARRRRRDSRRARRIEDALVEIKNETLPLPQLLEERFPALIGNPDFWWGLRYEKDELPMTFWEQAHKVLMDHRPRAVFRNKKLMRALCSIYPYFYQAVPADLELKRDLDCIEIVLEREPRAIAVIPPAVLVQNPNNIIGETLANFPLFLNHYQDLFLAVLDAGAWGNRDVVLGWLAGGGVWHDDIPNHLIDDPEIVRALNNPFQRDDPTFVHYPPGDVEIEYLTQEAEINPYVLEFATENMFGSMELAIAALSGKCGYWAAIDSMPQLVDDGEVDNNRQFCYQVAEYIRRKLRLHDAFVEHVLGSIDRPDTDPSAFAVLDQGEETKMAYKKVLADYAGVPTGKELTRLRRARKNLARGGIWWTY